MKPTEIEGEARITAEPPSLPRTDEAPERGVSLQRAVLVSLSLAALALIAYAPIWDGSYQFVNIDDDE
ncbi:MAG TPA: hypothetical protein VKF81_10770, partial [Blastocatellia bacterium]|nr:hypothetical protein [Blastocatellia bacterium]